MELSLKILARCDLVLSVLNQPEIRPKTAREIFYQLRSDSATAMGFTTVSRCLKRLTELGIVTAIDLGKHEAYYELAAKGHHDYMICDSCGSATPVLGCPFHVHREKVAEIEMKYKFEIREHKLLVFGNCITCSDTQKDAQ